MDIAYILLLILVFLLMIHRIPGYSIREGAANPVNIEVTFTQLRTFQSSKAGQVIPTDQLAFDIRLVTDDAAQAEVLLVEKLTPSAASWDGDEVTLSLNNQALGGPFTARQDSYPAIRAQVEAFLMEDGTHADVYPSQTVGDMTPGPAVTVDPEVIHYTSLGSVDSVTVTISDFRA
jgi:hypothetical protein